MDASDTGVCEKRLRRRRRHAGRWAFRAPNQGVGSSACCWIAWPRLPYSICFLTDTGNPCKYPTMTPADVPAAISCTKVLHVYGFDSCRISFPRGDIFQTTGNSPGNSTDSGCGSLAKPAGPSNEHRTRAPFLNGLWYLRSGVRVRQTCPTAQYHMSLAIHSVHFLNTKV